MNPTFPHNGTHRHRRRAPLTADLAAKIKKLAASTRLFQHEIAAELGLNQGRVSEVFTGKRYPEVPPAL
jgi:predicted XRE-type DNA-binding protein